MIDNVHIMIMDVTNFGPATVQHNETNSSFISGIVLFTCLANKKADKYPCQPFNNKI